MNPSTGGPVEGILSLQSHLQDKGCDVTVLCADDPAAFWVNQPAQPIEIVALGPITNGYGYDARWKKWLLENAGKFDAAIIHGVWKYHGWVARRVLGKFRIPFWIYAHGMLDPWFDQQYPLKAYKKRAYWHLIEKKNVQQSRGLILTSEEEMKQVRQHWGVEASKLITLPYGVNDPDSLDGPASSGLEPTRRSALQKEIHPRRLLFLGRLAEKKGLDLLISAFVKISAQNPGQYRLQIAGAAQDDNYLQQLKKWADGCMDIEFLGPVYGAQKEALLQNCNALCLPSHQENFGLVVAEALARSRPVLLCKGVNIWQTVIKAGAGSVRENTAAGVEGMLQEWTTWTPELWEILCRCARKCFEQNFSATTVAEHLLQYLENSLNKNSGK